jgi:hypothetical protein
VCVCGNQRKREEEPEWENTLQPTQPRELRWRLGQDVSEGQEEDSKLIPATCWLGMNHRTALKDRVKDEWLTASLR